MNEKLVKKEEDILEFLKLKENKEGVVGSKIAFQIHSNLYYAKFYLEQLEKRGFIEKIKEEYTDLILWKIKEKEQK